MKAPFIACIAGVIMIVPAVAQQEQKLPPRPEMPTGGSERQPGGFVAAEGPDQILMKNLVGQTLYGPNSERIGTVKDALLDRRRNTIDVLIVDIGKGKDSERPVALADVNATDRKHPTAALGKSDLSSAAPDRQNGQSLRDLTKQNPDLVSVSDQILGRKVKGRNHERLGAVHDLVVNYKDGHVVAALIEPGPGMGITGAPRAVPWNVVMLPDDKKGPLPAALSKDEFDKEPAFASMAPGTEGRNPPFSGASNDPKTGRGKTGTEKTLDFGGGYAPPPTRRID